MKCCISRMTSWIAAAVIGLSLVANVQGSAPATNVIFSTGFEFEEGYDPGFTLIGQKGWLGLGTGGNGILTNAFEGFGQQAYIGFQAPEQTNEFLNVWRPISFPSISTNSIVKFTVLMQIIDSSNNQWDDFRWSAYNSKDNRLFTIDFDNSALKISYALDDNKGFQQTTFSFDNKGFYELEITMNFSRNLWSASLNDTVVVNSQPITTTGATLDLSDVDAVWAIRKPGSPGDNYMIFDDYKIAVEAVGSIQPRLESVGFQQNGDFVVRVHGEVGRNYIVEGSSDLVAWQNLQVISAPTGGSFDYRDTTARQSARRFYRVRNQP